MMTRTALVLLTGTFLTLASCSGDASLGDGTSAASKGGAAGTGTTGGAGTSEQTDGAAQTGGSGGSSSTGTAGGSGSAMAGSPGTGGGIPTVDGGVIEAGGSLTWRPTCGDPVCRVPPVNDVDSGIASCSTEMQAGKPCTTAGNLCDPHTGCGQKLMCADHKLDVMCPISNRDKKQDIRYLSSEDLERLADEVSKVRLTTYTYRDPSLGSDQHLGFIIEDNPQSPAVYPNQHHVDLYGYASMAVAALQVQEKQLQAQQAQMADLRRELSAVREELRAAQGSSCRP
jgi:hypothetical protein